MSDTHDQQVEKAAKALAAYLRELHGIWRVAPTRQTAFNAARAVLDAVASGGNERARAERAEAALAEALDVIEAVVAGIVTLDGARVVLRKHGRLP